jgi:hypothetical protein
MPIVIFSAVMLLIFTIIAMLACHSSRREDEEIKSLARDNHGSDLQADHEQLCCKVSD